MFALYWPAEPQTPDRHHPGLELLFAVVPEVQIRVVRMPEAQMTSGQMIDPQTIEGVKTATLKMTACQPEDRMTLDLMRQNSDQKGRHKADWSDTAFSEWWICRDCLFEGQD
ncbi:MAG: hypothetical protein DWI00_12855 [Planctomycetota bacterium]|nr:MAG: hypothetical protein DWI00_12855 [Planctomycetota bacterium]